ncbi:hypothetical protein Poly30_06070 [Planctomycetes bacterium Poly30]|uniref:MAM domain-containing protein n=1 Tax=Saltatorellus ferox TaxID=2528018 RepID=A0A518ELZ6_9BACT|nr:hypothetical protein Poly30_06070 [Planctomycetes bacterium Poly30]
MKPVVSPSLVRLAVTGVVFASIPGMSDLAVAQSTLYETDFSSADGWTFEQSHPWGNQTFSPEWNVDALPASPAFAPFHSEPTSLNFNHNELGLEWGEWAGSARSPEIDLAESLGTPRLHFWYAYDHETFCQWDAFSVQVLDAGTEQILFQECLSATDLGLRNWVEYDLALDRSWGTVRIRFVHDTLDDWNFNEAGSYVDDLHFIDPRGASLHCEGQPLFNGAGPARLSMALIGQDPEGPVLLRGTGFPANGFAFAFAGPDPGVIPIGHGIRCIGVGTSVRVSLAPTRDLGTPVWSLDPNAGNFAQMAMLDVPIYVQTIFRDGPTINLSDALVFCP